MVQSVEAGRSGFGSRQGQDFSILHSLQMGSEATQPAIQWVSGALFPGVTGQGVESDHSLPSSAEVKNDRAIPPLPPMSSWHGAHLIKHRKNFTFSNYRIPKFDQLPRILLHFIKSSSKPFLFVSHSFLTKFVFQIHPYVTEASYIYSILLVFIYPAIISLLDIIHRPVFILKTTFRRLDSVSVRTGDRH
jgi:hypothetical protein